MRGRHKILQVLFLAGRCCMFFFTCRSVLICVGCMEHSDSAAVAHASTGVSNFKKQTTITLFFN